MVAPPELLNETINKFSVPVNSQLILLCKCRSTQKPTIKWFRMKEESFPANDERMLDSYNNFIENSRSIKYFENFYEPITSSGLKETTENVYLSKLIVNNITQSSIYVCVAINYYGFSYRESFIKIQAAVVEDLDDVFDYQENNYEILILIPIVLLMPSSVLMCTLFYLLINRQIMKNNKNEIV